MTFQQSKCTEKEDFVHLLYDETSFFFHLSLQMPLEPHEGFCFSTWPYCCGQTVCVKTWKNNIYKFRFKNCSQSVTLKCKLDCACFIFSMTSLFRHTDSFRQRQKLTKLLQGWDAKLVIMVVADGCVTFSKNLKCDCFCRELHGIHAVDETLEALVRKRRVTIVQFYDPIGKKNDNHQTHKHRAGRDNPQCFTSIAVWYVIQMISYRRSPGQIVEGVWIQHRDFYPGLAGEFLNGSITFLAERLRVVFIR